MTFVFVLKFDRIIIFHSASDDISIHVVNNINLIFCDV